MLKSYPPFLMLLILFMTGVVACNSQANEPNTTTIKPSLIVDNDTKTIKQLLLSFFEAYQPEINKSDRRVKTYIQHPQAFHKRYFEGLRNTDVPAFKHLHSEFLSQLKEALYTCDYEQGASTAARACSEPVFQSVAPAQSLNVIAVDAEDDEAVAHTQLSDNPNQKTIFTLNRIDGKWMIIERENTTPIKLKPVLPIDDWGVYQHPHNPDLSYQIFKRDGVLALEYCVNSNCQRKGVIIGNTMTDEGKTLELKDFPTGELVPKWIIKGKQLLVFDYSVQEDKWEETVYLQAESKG